MKHPPACPARACIARALTSPAMAPGNGARHQRRAGRGGAYTPDLPLPLCDALEPRTLFAAPPPVVFSGTDADGDQYTVRLTGGGTMVVTPQDGGGIQSIALSNTTEKSALTISVRRANAGSGAVALGAITHNDTFPLKSIFAPQVDLVGAGLTWGDAAIGSIRFRDILNGADVTVGGTTTDRSAFSARFISNTSGEATTLITFAGRLDSFNVGAVFFCTLNAHTIGSLRVNGTDGTTGTASAFSMQVDGVVERTGHSVDNLYVKGAVVGGIWNFEGDVPRVQAGSFDGEWQGTFNTTVDTFIVSGAFGGSLQIRSVRTVRVGGVFSAGIVTNGDIDVNRYGVRNFNARSVSGGSITSADQNVGTVRTRQWEGGGISANRLALFQVVGGGGFAGGLSNFSGQINDVDFDNALGEFFVRGTVQGTTLRVLGNTRKVSVGGVLNFRFFGGVLESVSTFPSSLSDFEVQGGILKEFKVRGNFERDFFGNPVFGLRNIQVAAREIRDINFRPRIQFDNSGTAFGVVTSTLRHMSFRVTPDNIVSIRNLDQPGSGQAYTRGDMVVRIV